MSKVLVTIQYDVEPAKREAYLEHARQMRDHAVDVLGLDYHVFEEEGRPGRFTEVFACPDSTSYEELEDRQDDRFRHYVAELERYTDLPAAHYAAMKQVV